MSTARKRIVILGATGSIGCQTLDVVRSHPDRFEVVGLACNSSCDRLVQQITEFDVPAACLRDASGAIATWPASCERLPYPEGLEQLAARDDVDIVVVATVGDVGFRPTEAALRAGNTVALASKELLVMGGQLFRDLADSTGTQILPIDSEHSALWQCLAGEAAGTVRRLILTASGGPFRETDAATVRDATAEEALKHPNWVMGPKITTDSASLMNKGLEVIEARWLFGTPADRIDVVVHPQSVVHSLVELCDGSVIAQMGVTDMRLPIQYAFSYPDRWDSRLPSLDLAACGRLEFSLPDLERFPCLGLAYRALRGGPALPVALNAANEVAVEAFLAERLAFTAIPAVIAEALDDAEGEAPSDPMTLDDVRRVHAAATRYSRLRITELQSRR